MLPAEAGATALQAGFNRADLDTWHKAVDYQRDKLLMIAKWVIIVVFGFGGIWAATVPLGGAVVATGRVVAENHNRIVQHLEGGILSELLVHEGEHVEKGQVLARLDDSQLRPQLENMKLQRAIRRVQLARRQAEITGADKITLPAIDPSIADNPSLKETIQGQTSEFNALKDLTLSQIDVLNNKIKATESDIEGRKAVIKALNKQADLYELELKDYKNLYKKGLVQRTKVFATERQLASLRANIATAKLEMGKSRNDIISIQSQISQVKLQRIKDAEDISTQLQKELNQYESQISRVDDMIKRTYLRAPTAGTVFRIAQKTLGGVIKPGQPIMEIVPSLEEYRLEVQISVKDIESVHVGQDVTARFISVKQRGVPPLKGKITYLSSDAVVSQGNPMGNYVAYVAIDDDSHEAALVPGNIASVFIQTEPMTFLEMMLQPITRFTQRAFVD